MKEIGGGFWYWDGTEVKYNLSNDNKTMDGYFFFAANEEKKMKFMEIYEKNKEFFAEI